MNILILTSEYPGNYKGSDQGYITPVVHFFAKEWKKAGHNVLVIHNAPRYPYIIHALPERAKEYILNKVGFSVMGLDYIKPEQYEWEGISVWRLPIIKFIPHGDHPKYIIKKQIRKVIDIIKGQGFQPDIMICHWPSPQMQMAGELKNAFHCKVALTLHGLGYLQNKDFDYKKYIDNIDAVGFRNATDARKGQDILKLKYMPYVCLSGIPPQYIDDYDVSTSKFNDLSIFNVVYVGRLVERKHVDVIINALQKSNIDKFHLDIIGTGPCQEALENLTNTIPKSRGEVVFHGRMSREKVMEFNKNAHAFVMVSEREPFGLVYLEAMAAKCITIGSVGEGIDGIIENGINGFLTDSGNEAKLISVLNYISQMTINQMIEIAEKANTTARKMTDEKVAQRYLDDLIDLFNINSLSSDSTFIVE